MKAILQCNELNKRIVRKFKQRNNTTLSILYKYQIANEDDPKEWKLLENKEILLEDIDRLVYVLGVKYEQRLIQPNNSHHRRNRYYMCKDFNSFRLYYVNEK